MPAKSKAQMRALFALARQGKVKPAVAEEFAVSGEAYRRLPEHVAKPKGRGKGRGRR